MSFVLGPAEVHIWQAPLQELACDLPKMAALLCREEEDRAARFHFRRDYEQFVLSRGILRLLLAKYVGGRPEEIAFRYSPNGKPALDGPSRQGAKLQFNLSHTAGMAVYAFVHYRKVGIDVEQVRDLSGLDGIAAQIFTPAELIAYHSTDSHNRQRCFFSGWTRKEAFIKACGEGWSRSPQTFAVSLAINEPARLLRIEEEAGVAGYWKLFDVTTEPSYAAALAVEDTPSCTGKELQLLFRSPDELVSFVRG
jgi:4'-phosphopantetheinyl transferase